MFTKALTKTRKKSGQGRPRRDNEHARLHVHHDVDKFSCAVRVRDGTGVIHCSQLGKRATQTLNQLEGKKTNGHMYGSREGGGRGGGGGRVSTDTQTIGTLNSAPGRQTAMPKHNGGRMKRVPPGLGSRQRGTQTRRPSL